MPPRPILSSRVLHETPLERTSTRPEEETRKIWLTAKYGPVFDNPRFARLRASLTAHGGWDLVPDPNDPQLELLLSDSAAVWNGRGARWTIGEPNRCHGNAAYRFLRMWPRYLIGTGYALDEDGVWIGHTWLMEHRRGQPTRIVETTVGRLLYAGVVLDPAGVVNPVGRGFLPGGRDTMRFALGNLGSLDDAPAMTHLVNSVIDKDPRFLAVVATCASDMVNTEQLRNAIMSRQVRHRVGQLQDVRD